MSYISRWCAPEVERKVDGVTWVLGSPVHAPKGSQIERFSAILAPLEAMSHTLFWTNEALYRCYSCTSYIS